MLKVKAICSAVDEYLPKSYAIMKQKLFQRKYNGGNLNKLMDNVDLIEKKDFCKLKKRSATRTIYDKTSNSFNMQQKAFKHIRRLVHFANQFLIP